MIELARARGTGVVLSPLDSYVTGRLVSLSVPVREVMSRDPLVREPDDLLSDVTDRMREVHYSAAIVVDEHGAPRRPDHPRRAGQPDAAPGAAG